MKYGLVNQYGMIIGEKDNLEDATKWKRNLERLMETLRISIIRFEKVHTENMEAMNL